MNHILLEAETLVIFPFLALLVTHGSVFKVISGDAVYPFSQHLQHVYNPKSVFLHPQNINPVYIKGIISEDIYVLRGIVENMVLRSALPSSALKKVQDASRTIIAQKWNCVVVPQRGNNFPLSALSGFRDAPNSVN